MARFSRLVPLLVLTLVAGCSLGGGGGDEPFALEPVDVERIEAATSAELADAIVEQLDGWPRGTYTSPADTPRDPREARAQWSALVALAVYRDQAALNGLAPYDGRGAEVSTSAGVRFSAALGGEGVPVGSYRTASEDAFRRIVERNVADLGLELVSLEFVHPEGIGVPIAVVRAPDAFLERSGGAALGYSIFRGAYPETRSLGWYADVVGSSGDWVQSQGLVPTAGSGKLAVAERWRGRDACGGPVLCTVHG